MGLDNGINFKITDQEKFGEIPEWINYTYWDAIYGSDYEIQYWRKCWNVRDVIFSILRIEYENDNGEYKISLDDLITINKKLRKIYTKKHWDETRSIWSYKEIKRSFRQNLKYANRIAKWLKTKPEGSFELYFYDSY